MKKRILFLLFLIVIVSVSANTAPVFNEDKTREINLKEYENFNYQLKANDADNDELIFIDLANLTNFKSFKMNSSGYINFIVNQGDMGYFPVILIVRDTYYDADVITWNFNITNSSNVPPNVVYYLNTLDLSINENESIKFNANASDNNNDALISKWFLDNVEKTSNTNYYIYSADFNSAGQHNITFEVNDGNTSTFVRWNVTINNVNLAPYLIQPIENITMYQNSEYSFNLNEYFKDDDGNKLNYSVNKVDNVNISINNDTSEVIIFPDEDFTGERELIFNVIDASYVIPSNTINLSVIKRSRRVIGEDADNKDRKKKESTEEVPVEEPNQITGQTINPPKESKIIETILEKAGFNNDMFKKPNISWGVIGSLLIIGVLVTIWIKVRINRRRNFGF